jgi:hypothetical protein
MCRGTENITFATAMRSSKLLSPVQGQSLLLATALTAITSEIAGQYFFWVGRHKAPIWKSTNHRRGTNSPALTEVAARRLMELGTNDLSISNISCRRCSCFGSLERARPVPHLGNRHLGVRRQRSRDSKDVLALMYVLMYVCGVSTYKSLNQKSCTP